MNYLSFIVYVITTAITPGPNNLASMANMSKVGFRKGIKFNIGIFLSQIIIMLICVLFCTYLKEKIPAIQLPMKIAGALYILYLAYKTYKSKEIEYEDQKDVGGKFVEGFLLNTLNVKYFLYCIVSLETYIIPNTSNINEVLVYAVPLTLFALTSHVTWGALGTILGKVFNKRYKTINTIFAVLLVFCAFLLFI